MMVCAGRGGGAQETWTVFIRNGGIMWEVGQDIRKEDHRRMIDSITW